MNKLITHHTIIDQTKTDSTVRFTEWLAENPDFSVVLTNIPGSDNIKATLVGSYVQLSEGLSDVNFTPYSVQANNKEDALAKLATKLKLNKYKMYTENKGIFLKIIKGPFEYTELKRFPCFTA